MATTANMIAIQTVTVGATGSTSIDFNNIPQIYTDLYVSFSLRGDGYNATDTYMKFNSNSSDYSYRLIWKDGNTSTPTSTSASSQSAMLIPFGTGSNTTANTFSNQSIYVPNYNSSNFKTVYMDSAHEGNSLDTWITILSGLWSNTSAITSLSLLPVSGKTWVQNSTATLYGITSVSKGVTPKATGGTITETDTHIIHTFNSTGSFIPSQNLTCDFLVVGGGGGAGNNGNGGWPGGGGGAGGYRTATAQAFTSGTTYTMTIGGGGGSQSGGSGSSISGAGFTTFSTSGGGYGGTGAGSSGQGGQAGSGGGSGGGGSSNGDPSATNSGGSGNAGGYTPVEGYRGGDGRWQPAGAGGSSSRPGGALWTGTVGTFNDISGTSVEYAHGGAPGSGGADSPWLNGLANRGYGGDGGNAANAVGRSGGSGVVIIRYAK